MMMVDKCLNCFFVNDTLHVMTPKQLFCLECVMCSVILCPCCCVFVVCVWHVGT